MTVYIQVSDHQPSAEFYAALARVFTEQTNGDTSWVEFTADGVRVTVFKLATTDPQDT